MVDAVFAVWPWWSGALLAAWWTGLVEATTDTRQLAYGDQEGSPALGVLWMLSLFGSCAWAVGVLLWLVGLA